MMMTTNDHAWLWWWKGWRGLWPSIILFPLISGAELFGVLSDITPTITILHHHIIIIIIIIIIVIIIITWWCNLRSNLKSNSDQCSSFPGLCRTANKSLQKASLSWQWISSSPSTPSSSSSSYSPPPSFCAPASRFMTFEPSGPAYPSSIFSPHTPSRHYYCIHHPCTVVFFTFHRQYCHHFHLYDPQFPMIIV